MTVTITVGTDTAAATAANESLGWDVALDLYESLSGQRCNRTQYVSRPAGGLGTYSVRFGDNDGVYLECEVVFS